MSLNRELNLEKINERLKKFSKDRNWELFEENSIGGICRHLNC